MKITADFLTDPALQSVLSMLQTGGHRALIVGGAVRNALLDQPVGDVDIATDAAPERVVTLAHAAGLKVHPWTFRRENYFLPLADKGGLNPAGHGDLAAEIDMYLKTGIDGLFSDNPREAVPAVQAGAKR